MISVEVFLGFVMIVALAIYAVSGGADFGGGLWDLMASGARAKRQQETIQNAIGPIWEANHVWLIIVIVVMFVAFPKAYAAIGTLLHIPLTLVLLGIVLRGSAFVFRTYDSQEDNVQRRWSLTFSIASAATPIMLGISLGAVASGRLPVTAIKTPGKMSFWSMYVGPWLQPFPIAVGLYVLALFSFVAAVYLILETDDQELREDFRLKALWSGAWVGVLAWICFGLAVEGAPLLYKGLSLRWWSVPFQVAVAGLALVTFGALWVRQYFAARILVILQVGAIVFGWGLVQYPYVIVPTLTIKNTAAPASVLWPVAIALLAGCVVLIPSFAYLYRLFKQAETPYP